MAVLGQEGNAFSAFDFKTLQAPASALGLQLHQINVRSAEDFKSAFAKITRTLRANAVFLQPAAVFNDNGKRIADLAIKNRLPAIYDSKELPEAGVLMEHATGSANYAGRAGAAKLHEFRGSDQRVPSLSLERSIREDVLFPGRSAKENL